MYIKKSINYKDFFDIFCFFILLFKGFKFLNMTNLLKIIKIKVDKIITLWYNGIYAKKAIHNRR